MIAKIDISVAALPIPMMNVHTSTPMKLPPSWQKGRRRSVPIMRTGAPIRMVVCLDVFAMTGPKISIPVSCATSMIAIV